MQEWYNISKNDFMKETYWSFWNVFTRFGEGREETMTTRVIIIRPAGGRLFKYMFVDGGGVNWSDDPEAAFIFDKPETAEKYKIEKKTSFGIDDRIVERRKFNGRQCNYCYQEGETLRRNYVEYDENHARIELQCSHCSIIQVARYAFEETSKGSLDSALEAL